MSGSKGGGFQRFLTKREKRSSGSHSRKSESSDQTKETEVDAKLKAVQLRLAKLGIKSIKDAHIEQVLRGRYAHGDTDRAVKVLLLYEDSIDGIVKDFDPNVKLVGAENRGGVTCYLDALLFAMFARLDTFEAMLYKHFDDEARQNLVVILRVWVNMLRSGILITEDVTRKLQECLADCGWEDAGKMKQQDTTEAFTFISEILGLPQLTFKMDIYHTGKEEETSDHKFVNEQLLQVAIPEDPGNAQLIPLEICLENYFNNRIEIRRYMDRRGTMDSEKAALAHIESIEVSGEGYVSSPISQYPPSPASSSYTPSPFSPARRRSPNFQAGTIAEEPSGEVTASGEPRSGMQVLEGYPPYSVSPTSERPSMLRNRSNSIIKEVIVGEGQPSQSDPTEVRPSRGRKSSIRKQVDMPAWQFFSLLPWYTANTPTNDAQVTAHFSSKRPTLGICLKRYGMSNQGRLYRLDTKIDIPLEIRFPSFIQDDRPQNNGPLGDFKLVLQSVVCHRGASLHSGHYIALVRGTAPNGEGKVEESRDLEDARDGDGAADPWMRFDDLRTEGRIEFVNIGKTLVQEMPYLLFYQIQPIHEDPPPPYDSDSVGESATAGLSEVETNEARPSIENSNTRALSGSTAVASSNSQKNSEGNSPRSSVETKPKGLVTIDVIPETNGIVATAVGVHLNDDADNNNPRSKDKKSKKKRQSSHKGRGTADADGKIPERECVAM